MRNLIKNTNPMAETCRTAENGIDIFCYPNPGTHSFCLSLYIRAGALYETDGENGITHFLEHILFRNINYRMGGRLYRRLDQLGLYFNGATYKEFMQLYIIGAPQHFDEAAQLLLKAFDPLTLPADEIKTEQQRVKAEIREAGDLKTLDYFAGTLCWKDTPLRNTILGTKGNVSSFSRRKLAAYHDQAFCPENAFFYVTGRVTEQELTGFAGRVSALCFPSKGVRRDNRAPVPEGFGARDLLIGVKNSPYTMVQFSYDVVTERYTGAELALLYDVLFSGESSLMHQELSEKRGMIYSYTSTLEKYNNIGRIYFAYEVAARDLYASVEVVRDGLTQLRTDMEDRLSLVLPEYTDNAYMIYDDNENFNWQRAYENHIMDGGERSIEESRQAYLAVTPQRLSEMAAEIFTADHLVLSLKGDQKKIDQERLRNIFGRQRTKAQKTDCDSGGTMNFKQAFFRIYDRKIASGEITFSRTGIRKDDFTKLCTEPGFVLDQETLERLAVTMKLTEEEQRLLAETAAAETAEEQADKK